MRPWFAIALLFLLNIDATTLLRRQTLGEHAVIEARRVPLDSRDPARVRLGPLTYLGGVVLTSPDPAFGGFSSMRVMDDHFTLVSDNGNVVAFRMGADWRIRDPRFGDLPGGPGTGWKKEQRDAESLAWDSKSGRAWIGFERYNAIYRYDAALSRVEAFAAPPAMADWSVAGGPESMVRLRSGQFLVIAETARPKGWPDARIGLRFAGDPTEPHARPVRFGYAPPPGYNPTDIAELPDGRLLVLNRRLSLPDLFTAKLSVIDLRGVRAGGVVKGVEIATFARPLLHDNFEALAVTREGDATIVWIASDDNSEVWEQSLLLKFRLDLAAIPARAQQTQTGAPTASAPR